ncbi:hypothetical protein FQA39_LY15812 [Lamprigera yunnana]|nr:hypothetical protein FQA39_LY15812 [Lamprigera yunnana]
MKWIKKVAFKSHHGEEANRFNFHASISFVIRLGQYFAIMPLQGINGQSANLIRFTWKSWKVLYSFVIIIGSLFCACVSMYAFLQEHAKISLISATMFYATSFVMHVLFVLLAKDWSHLMKRWCTLDKSMRSYGYPPHLNLRLKTLSAVILFCAFVEHLLVFVKNLISINNCKHVEFAKYYFAVLSYPQVFAIVEYRIWWGIMVQLLTTISTFSWTYIDLFIILLSTSLAERFKQVTERVEAYVNSMVVVSDIVLWRNVREDYNRISKLCKTLNECISYIVLLSFGSNLFFILVQFFYSIRPIDGTMEKVYFFYSFGFLIGRTICVSLYGSWIHDESQKPLPLLNSVASIAYNVEIRRFILHIGIETVSLSGKKFFNVTRSIVLSIATTIVTYELVLIQFYAYQNQSVAERNSSCSA